MFVASEVPSGPELVVKVLPGKLSLAVNAGVFERELLLLSDRLRHPGLVAPRSAGRAGAFIYHTRPFVEGTTLRALVTRSGELPLRQAVAVLRDLLAGLAHAHAGRVAHGDLKPENVLLAEGRVLCADAGVVDAVERALDGAAPGAASAALCAGTYLAPERRERGSPAQAGPPDDMFALGVLAHEMLAGRPPDDLPQDRRSAQPGLDHRLRRCATAAAPARAPRRACRSRDCDRGGRIVARALVDRGVFLEPRSGAACTHAQGLAAHGIAAPRSLALVLRGLSPTPVPPAARALGCGTCPHAGECGPAFPRCGAVGNGVRRRPVGRCYAGRGAAARGGCPPRAGGAGGVRALRAGHRRGTGTADPNRRHHTPGAVRWRADAT